MIALGATELAYLQFVWAIWYFITICSLLVTIMSASAVLYPETHVSKKRQWHYTTTVIALYIPIQTFLLVSMVKSGYQADYLMLGLLVVTFCMEHYMYVKVKNYDNWFDDKRKQMKEKLETIRAKRFGVGVTTGGRW